MKEEWTIDAYRCLRKKVVIRGFEPTREGTYDIIIQARPQYCDRGDWIIFVEGENNDIDGADGFPRYFFGTEEQVKSQMDTWLNRRGAYHDRP